MPWPRPPVSFELQERKTRRLTYLVAALLFVAIYGLAWLVSGPLIGLVVCVPILGVFGSWLLVTNCATGCRWIRWLALRGINGNYNAFDDCEVRVEWRDGQCRVAARDVFKALGEELDDKTCRQTRISYGEKNFWQDEHGEWWFGEEAIRQWLNRRANKFDRRAHRLYLWLEREVFPPLRRRAEISRSTPTPIPPVCSENAQAPVDARASSARGEL